MNTIMLVDDDINICTILKSQLESDGYKVFTYNKAEDLLKDFYKNKSDLIITDIMMPGMNGYDLCREIRKNSDVPIVMISAKDEEIDKVLGLELGSDDYISKPFSLREISIKVRNMLKRYSFQNTPNNDTLICKDMRINTIERTIFLCDKPLMVTAKEYELLEFLLKNKNIALSRDSIIENVWGYDFIGDTRQVDHLIKRLRKKLIEFDPVFKIETLWGFGYKVCDKYETS